MGWYGGSHLLESSFALIFRRVGGAFIRRGHLKEGGLHKFFLIFGGAFIRERLLKEGGHLLEDLPYVSISRNIWLSLSTVKTHSDMWCEVLWKCTHCEKFIAKCFTFVNGIIIFLYKGKICLPDTNLGIINKACVFLSKISFLWWEHICFKALLTSDFLISSILLQL